MVNVSEGRDGVVLAELAAAATPMVIDQHTDPDHHRSVFTLAGEADEVTAAVRALAALSVERLDLRAHDGVHPRLGVLDVVPFVPYEPGQMPSHDLSPVVSLRDHFAQWLSANFAVPSFLYGPLPGGRNRTLPQLRREAFGGIPPDFGPDRPHRTAGATAVGAREVLVAYNLWVSSAEVARLVARRIRGPMVRALGLVVGEGSQVSCNLIDPANFGPEQAFDSVAAQVANVGGAVVGAELVGLVPQAVLKAIPRRRWPELGLSVGTTVEARLTTR